MNLGTGDALLLTTDHYRVQDPNAVRGVLSLQPDVEQDAGGGWMKIDRTAHRVLASLRLDGDRLEVFGHTRGLADEARVWLEGLAGEMVRHVAREHTDPLSNRLRGSGPPRR